MFIPAMLNQRTTGSTANLALLSRFGNQQFEMTALINKRLTLDVVTFAGQATRGLCEAMSVGVRAHDVGRAANVRHSAFGAPTIRAREACPSRSLYARRSHRAPLLDDQHLSHWGGPGRTAERTYRRARCLIHRPYRAAGGDDRADF